MKREQRRCYILDEMEVPRVYDNDSQQKLYEEEYRQGRLIVIFPSLISIGYLRELGEERLRGYLDGIRDEILFQSNQKRKKAVK